MAVRKKYYAYSINTIWGLAKSPELCLTDEELHIIVERETGKESIKTLTRNEIILICNVLGEMKDKVTGKKRIDRKGNSGTVWQRKKIYELTEALGWNTNTNRINGFVKRMFKVDRIEWLDYMQCSVLIEALKEMVKRQEKAKESC